MPRSISAMMASTVNTAARPPMIHATGKPVKSSAMNATNISAASTSLSGMADLPCPEEERQYPAQARSGGERKERKRDEHHRLDRPAKRQPARGLRDFLDRERVGDERCRVPQHDGEERDHQ